MNRQVTRTNQESSGVMPAPSSVLLRKCACGNHAMAGGECEGCGNKRERMLLRKTANSAKVSEVPPIVHEVLRSPGQPLDPATRAFMEPRFGHDFSGVRTRAASPSRAPARLSLGATHDHFEQEAEAVASRVTHLSTASADKRYDFNDVRIHSDAQAAKSAQAINALAYTVGRDIVFGAGQYAPHTDAGRKLMAHELTHVMQQSYQPIATAQRAPDDPKDAVQDYAEFLKTHKKNEGKPDSKKKALAMIETRVKGTFGPFLPDDLVYLLILELAAGKPNQADVDGMLEVLERMGNSQLGNLFKPDRVNLDTLVGLFTGKDKVRLEDFFTRRFEGGLSQVKAGKIKPIGSSVQTGVALSSLAIIKETVTWLSTHKKTATVFFGEVWSKNKIVLLGEIHLDDVQRQFAADMLADKGGKDVGLALEIDADQQAEVNYYIEHGVPPKGAKGWWTTDDLYKKLIDKAKSTKTQVIAMDTHTGTDRDTHMAAEVEKLAKSKSKILVYVGAMHIKEVGSGALGEKLAAKFGGSSYAINISRASAPDNIYWMINAAFPKEKSLGFDIDESPLAKHPDPQILAMPTFGMTLDGYIYFSSTAAYK